MTNYSWLPKPEQFPKKNALTPIGALSFGVFAAAVIGAIVLRDSPLAWALIGMSCVPMAATIWGFLYFAKNDPDRLQTEDYRIQREIVARVTHFDGFGDRHVPPPDAPLVPKLEDRTNGQ